MNVLRRVTLEYSAKVSRTLTVAASSHSSQASVEIENVRPFEEIPAVKGLPFIGSSMDYMQWRGFELPYLKDHLVKRHNEYGDIYREKMSGVWNVFCRSPADTKTMFRSDGRFPGREPQISAKLVREKMGAADFITNFQGEEWYTYRKLLNPLLLQNKAAWSYIDSQRIVSKDMAEYIGQNMDENGEVPDFDNVLRRWSLEMAGTFILDTRLGLLSNNDDPEMNKILKLTANFVDFFFNSFMGFKLWKYYETKEFKEAVKCHKKLFEIVEGVTKQSLQANTTGKSSIMQRILESPELNEKQKRSLQVDLIIAAFETTSMAASLMLYALTLNSKFQEKLRNEILSLPQGVILSGRIMDRMEYMNAFTKEAMRMFPFSHIFGRAYPEDLVLSGFNIPAGTFITNTTNCTNNRNPKFFDEPESFMPERYMKNKDDSAGENNKFLFTGHFGFGARACVGRHFAIQEIRLLVIELLKAYRVEYHHNPIVSVFRGTGVPSEKSRFKFIPLES